MDQYCAKCRSLIRAGSVRCAKCGEIAGDIFDGKIRKPDRKGGDGFFSVLVVLLALTGAYWWWSSQQQAAMTTESRAQLPSTRVVGDRPGGVRTAAGAKLNEAEAIRMLQRQLVAGGKTLDCLVISSQGFRDGSWRLVARDRCQSVRLGRFAIDGDTGRISRGV